MSSSSITDEMTDHYERYKGYFENNEPVYLSIVNDILSDKGEHRRKFKKIFSLARLEFLNTTTTPDYLGLFNGASGYVDDSIKAQQSRLKRLGVLDAQGLFKESFFQEYLKRYDDIQSKKKILKAVKGDSTFFEDQTVAAEYDYLNTMDVIRKTPTTIYHLPNLPVTTLNYFDTKKIQIIKMNHVGGNPVVQLPLSYHYRCNKCKDEVDMSFDVKNVPCVDMDCGGAMVRVKDKDIVRPVYASRVVTDDANSISIISLTEIPQGEFIGAAFLCKNKTDYYLFMIATEDIEPTSSTITITPDRHAIWQIIEQIDLLHDTLIHTHIDGMDWYKAAILLAYLANRKGRVSTNVLIVGGPGVGKTSTPRLYAATLTPQQKVVDSMQLTGPGLHGSMTQIKIGDSTVMVPEVGFLARYQLVVIDELLENRNSLMPQLKSALLSSTISREVAGNRTQTPKYATAIATSNPIPSVLVEQLRWMNKWLEAGDGTWDYSDDPAKDAMIAEWTLRGLEWRTGQTLADMDRYPLLFFVTDSTEDVSAHELGGRDNEIDDMRLSKLLYNADINEYFSFCGRIHVDWTPHTGRVIDLVRELMAHDKIHSKKRLAQNITLMLQLSAQINGRANLTDDDFAFVRELWSKTCEWLDVEELRHTEGGYLTRSGDWTIERIKNEIHTYMRQCEGVSRYHLTPTGFAMIAAKLEDAGAPADLIADTIEHYRANPNQ